MLDIKFIRENPEKVKEAAKNKGVDVDIDKILEMDNKTRTIKFILDNLRYEGKIKRRDFFRKNVSVLVGATHTKINKITVPNELLKISEKVADGGKELKKIEEEFDALMRRIPNIAEDGVPVGKDESENVVLRESGKKPKFIFQPKDYLEIAQELDIIDVERAAKVAGTRFGYLKGDAAMIELAVINFAFEFLTKKDFVPVFPPVMIKPGMAKNMGYFEQTDEDEAYILPKDDLLLVGTAEQSIGTMHANEIFEEKNLPRRYVAFSTCFRREAGSYGKDTKGIIRVHQFDKIEMFVFCKPEDSKKEHRFLLSLEEEMMKKLKIPYRIIQICTGDLGMPAVNKFDIEAWMPGQNQYRETHSTSNCTDFQARRLNIRYRDKSGKLNFVHTLNGTAIAIPRTLIAIIENYQQKDGSIKIPVILQKYARKKIIHPVYPVK